MHSLAPLIYDLAIMLGVASLVTLLFQRIGQPVVLGYLVAGIIIGPYTPPHALVNDIPNIKILSELGVVFLIFSLGLEFSFHKLTRVGFSASITGFFEVLLMTFFGFWLGKALGWSFNNALFLGAALSISSTTIIIKAIEELNLLKKRFAELIFGVLIIEDLLAILLLVALSTIVITHDVFSLDMAWVTGKLILVVGGWFIGGYFLIPTLHRLIMPYANEETITIISVGLCLSLVSLAAYLNYSTALGAFIMGSILAETSSIHRIRTLIKPVRDIFAAVFFISIGMLMNPKIMVQQWPVILLITIVTIVAKIVTTGLFTFLTGQGLNTSLRVGFSMAQIGEFSFIIVGLGIALNAVDNSLYPIIVSVSIITTFTTPYLIRLSTSLIKVLDEKLSEKNKLFLESYSVAMHKNLSKFSQDDYYKHLLSRLIVNGIIVAILFTLSYRLIFPAIKNFTDQIWLAKTLCWFVALLLSFPFLWGMIFSLRISKNVTSKNYFNLDFIIPWLLTLLEITFLSFIYFQTWPVVGFLVFSMIVFFALIYRKLEKTYRWFENHLTRNLRRKGKISQKYEELAPWNNYLVEVKVGFRIPLGKTIGDYRIRHHFGINIVAIQRGYNIIFAPTGKELILPQDKLIILGNEEQIDTFRIEIEEKHINQEPIDLLENIFLKSVILKKNTKLEGKTIRESKIQESIQGMVVGLERKGTQILNPDPTTPLHTGDLIFLVVKEEYLETVDKILK